MAAGFNPFYPFYVDNKTQYQEQGAMHGPGIIQQPSLFYQGSTAHSLSSADAVASVAVSGNMLSTDVSQWPNETNAELENEALKQFAATYSKYGQDGTPLMKKLLKENQENKEQLKRVQDLCMLMRDVFLDIMPQFCSEEGLTPEVVNLLKSRKENGTRLATE